MIFRLSRRQPSLASRSCLHDLHLLSGLSWRSNEHNTGTGFGRMGEGPEFLARRGRGTRKRGRAPGVRSYRPRACFRVVLRHSMQQLKFSTRLKRICRSRRGVGQRTLPSSQAAQLWNECRPLMFLWLPNANSGALGKTFMASSRTVSPDQASAVQFARGRPQRRQE